MDVEVATYVLAYLLRHNYAQSASAFLQECSVLPSRTVLVLPETPLQTIIDEHKTRKDTGLLLDALGAGSAWGALWEKLEQTLRQLRCLQEELLSSKGDKGSGGRRKPAHKASTYVKLANAQPSVPTAPPPNLTAVPSSSAQAMSTGHSSPQKRKRVQPRRKQLPDVQSSGTEVAMATVPEPGLQAPPLAPPPGMPQVVEALLGDSSLPGRLAEIINRCVTSSDGEAELSSQTLETILDLTCAQPEFEGLLSPEHAEICPQAIPPQTSSQSSLPQTNPRSPQSSLQASLQPLGSQAGVQRRPVEIRVIPDQAPGSRPAHETGSRAQDSGGNGQQGEAQPCKRPRLAGSNPDDPDTAKDYFPAELDIEKFLEQLHR